MLNMPGIRVSILLLPVWVGLIWLFYRLKQSAAEQSAVAEN
jgi:aromatic amino acid transport protein AroP